MRVDVVGVELGVLVPRGSKEFEFYSLHNPSLPFGFYAKKQYLALRECFLQQRREVLEYVRKSSDGAYGIISMQGVFKPPQYFMGLYDLEPCRPMSYEHLKDVNRVLYSVCKRDGQLVEGFLETSIQIASFACKSEQ